MNAPLLVHDNNKTFEYHEVRYTTTVSLTLVKLHVREDTVLLSIVCKVDFKT